MILQLQMILVYLYIFSPLNSDHTNVNYTTLYLWGEILESIKAHLQGQIDM